MGALDAYVWDLRDLPEALTQLGGGRASPPDEVPTDVDRSVLALAGDANLDAQAVLSRVSDLDGLLRGAAPAIARIGSTSGFLVVVGHRRRRVVALRRDLSRGTLEMRLVAEHLRAEAAAARAEVADRAVARLPERRRAACRERVIASLVASDRVGTWFLLRPVVAGGLRRDLWAQGVAGTAASWLGAHAVAYGLWVASWAVVGRGALDGRLEPGWLAGWAVLLASLAPLRALTVWLQGVLAVKLGIVLKQRLLVGALRMSADDVRGRGVGTLLGRVEEAATLERLALDGGLQSLLALVEWTIATLVVAWAGATVHAALGGVWLLAIVGVVAGMVRDRRRATHDRVAATHDLVEKLLGHRTRAVQELPEARHREEDEALAGYAASSARADRWAIGLVALTASWVLAGVVALGPSFVAGTATAGSLAVAIGGVLLIARALDALARGLDDLVEAYVAWEQVRDVLAASARAPSPPAPEARAVPPPLPGDPVLEARGVGFRYAGSPRWVLQGVDLRIARRDRILVQGASGGGKSTLASLLLGNRAPAAGTLLLDGLDGPAWGEVGWRERVSGAPQFHENHVLAGTLAFNLLLGRRWPPTPEDLEDAERLCYELGLGPLVERMPSGLHQLVGETGWQLSHGERSRVFLARALLQPAAVVVLDESFGALDAQATEWCLHRANRFEGALLVVAHP